MPRLAVLPAVVVSLALLIAPIYAGAVSQQDAALFSRKLGQILDRAGVPGQDGRIRTPVSETELNSWFAFSASPLLPPGISNPQVALLGGGKVSGQALVDLDAIGRRRSGGGGLDLWSLLAGKVPVIVSGVLQTSAGTATFVMDRAEISGVPIPKSVLQELVSFYSRTARNPRGIDIDGPFALPADIRQIDVGAGLAVIVQ